LTAPELDQLCIQVHLGRAPGLDTARLAEVAEAIARRTPGSRGFDVSRGEEEGAYLNLLFPTESLPDAWRQLHAELLEGAEFGDVLWGASMCICTGAQGWDDYRVLHHFDPTVPLDGLADD
jgi:hypothetical protein